MYLLSSCHITAGLNAAVREEDANSLFLFQGGKKAQENYTYLSFHLCGFLPQSKNNKKE